MYRQFLESLAGFPGFVIRLGAQRAQSFFLLDKAFGLLGVMPLVKTLLRSIRVEP
jgi:hypothetical protein